MNSREKPTLRTMDVQRESTQTELDRRDLLNMGLHSAGADILLPVSALSMRTARAIGQNGCNHGVSECLRPRHFRRARFRRFHL